MAHSSLIHHHKTDVLMRELGIPRREAVGLLEMLFQAANATPAIMDGTLAGWSARDIATRAGWDGHSEGRLDAVAPDAFVAALVAAKFLDRVVSACAHSGDHCWRIHDYLDWAPAYVKQRIKRRLKEAGQTTSPATGGETTTTQHNTTQGARACAHSDRACTNSDSPDLLKPPTWPTDQLQAIIEAYPGKGRRSGPLRQEVIVGLALDWLATNTSSPRPADPVAWLLAAVRRYANSREVESGCVTNMAKWFDPHADQFGLIAWGGKAQAMTDQGGGFVSTQQREQEHVEHEAATKRNAERLAVFRERWKGLDQTEQDRLIDEATPAMPRFNRGKRDPLKCASLLLELCRLLEIGETNEDQQAPSTSSGV